MITKVELKYYSSLLQKKYREAEKKFLVEGEKITAEALTSGFNCEIILITNDFLENSKPLLSKIEKRNIRVEIIKNNEIQKLADTITPQGIVGVFHLPDDKTLKIEKINSKLSVFLENISDPGNMGTIIRTCDWFGINDIILSKNCVDVFNPKVIRSSMGSVFHVRLYKEINSSETIRQIKNNGYKLLLADIDGEDVTTFSPPKKSVLILANEANGPSDEIVKLCDHKITIKGKGQAESLNVANASAILLYALSTK